MVFPLIKILMVCVKATARPIASHMKSIFTLPGLSFLQRYFVYIGRYAYRMETVVQNKLDNPKAKVKDIEVFEL